MGAPDSEYDAELRSDGAALRRLARALGGRDPEDIVQDGYVAALERGHSGAALRGFAASAIGNLTRSSRRSGARRRARELRAGGDRARAVAHPDDSLERTELLRAILDQIDALPPSQRQVVTLRYFDDLGIDEISARLGIAPATVRAHASRALATVRRRLDDESGGDRTKWLGVLLPSAAGLQSRATASTSALGGALLLNKLLWTSIAVVLAFAGLLAFWPSSPPSEDLAGADPLPARPPRLAEMEPVRGDSIGRVEATGPAVTRAPDATSESETMLTELEFVAALTGEPVPWLELQSFDENGQSERSYVSDANGRIELASPVASTSPWWFQTRETAQANSGPRTVEALGDGRVPVLVGPTFTFDWPRGDGPGPTEFRVSFREADVNRINFECEARVRTDGWGDGRPWVRLPASATRFTPGGAYVLVLSNSPIWRSTIPVTRSRGIDPGRLSVTLGRCGAAKFRALVGELGNSLVHVRLRRSGSTSGGGVAYFNKDEGKLGNEGREMTASIGWMEPGEYEWTIGVGVSAPSGTLVVEPGATAEVDLRARPIALPTFDAAVRIDAIDASDVDLEGLTALVSSVDDPALAFSELLRWGEDRTCTFQLSSLIEGEWRVTIFSNFQATLDRPSVIVSPSDARPTIRVLSNGPGAALALQVVDKLTGATIEGAECVAELPNRSSIALESKGGNGLASDKIPGALDVRLVVRAPGYRMRAVQHRSAVDGSERRIELERGWANRLCVIDARTYLPIPGIRVEADGELIGLSDDDGFVQLTGSGPPGDVVVARGQLDWAIVFDPFKAAPLESRRSDPIGGWAVSLMPSAESP